jgi:hypothetical protein
MIPGISGARKTWRRSRQYRALTSHIHVIGSSPRRSSILAIFRDVEDSYK